MFCPYCGAETADGARFCGRCGGVLEHQVASATQQENNISALSDNSPVQAGSSRKSASSRVGIILAVAGSLVAIVAIALAGFGVFSSGQPQSPSGAADQMASVEASAQQTSKSVSSAELANRAPETIVQMDAMYTYDEMHEDIDVLAEFFPELVKSSVIGKSVLGRDIDMVVLGNQNAAHNVLIQSTMHSSEYITTQTTMKTIEYYCKGYYDGAICEGTSVSSLLDSTCFYIVPMVNPDGVDIVQNGAAHVTSQATLDLLAQESDFRDWKANANGVDLNRNYSTGWENLSNPELRQATQPGASSWRGTSPESEPETQALIKLAQARDYDAFISYHMAGNCIYYDEPGNTDSNSKAVTVLANTINDCIRKTNGEGYRLDSMTEALENKNAQTTAYTVVQAGFNDWVQIELDKPGVTVEIGEGAQSQFERARGLPPEGQSRAGSLYEENRDTWAAVANIYQ